MTTPVLGAGCGNAAAGGDKQVQVDGVTGRYVVQLPQGYDANQLHPLLFAFGASDLTADDFRQLLDSHVFAAGDAVTVYADLLAGASGWNVQRDVAYFDSLFAQVVEQYCVDRSRVFLIGYAQGGMLASDIACQRGDAIRAAALFAGTTPFGSCVGSSAMFIAQGSMDPVFPVVAGRNTRDFWLRRNQCQMDSTPAAPEPCVDFEGCATPVRYCEFRGGHELPKFAASAAWSFFEALR